MTPAARFRRLLDEPGLIEAPGAFDAQTARLVELAGFPAVTLGGASLIASAFGLPDIGIVSIPEVIGIAGRIASVLDIPVLLDLDDGGGTPLRVRRFVRLVEEAGIAAVHIEDTDFAGGKHLSGRDGLGTTGNDPLLPVERAAANIEAAVNARRNPDTVIIARTDAVDSEGLDAALERARAYRAAGADAVFILHAPWTETKRVVEQVGCPVLNFALDPPSAQVRAQAEEDGLKIMVHPTVLKAACVEAAATVLSELRSTGTVARSLASDVGSRRRRDDIVRLREWSDASGRAT
jgi:2-methylisocitrate lyase-like PEP mutase family enzyme